MSTEEAIAELTGTATEDTGTTDAVEVQGEEVSPDVESPTEVGTEATEGATDASALSEGVLGRLRDNGLDAAMFVGMDDARVESMLSAIDRRVMAPQPQSQPVQQQVPTELPAEYEPMTLMLSDDLDASVSGPMGKLLEQVNGQMKQVHQFRQQMNQELQAINLLREFAEFDRHVSSLGEEWSEEYGSGSTMDMDQNSRQYQNRLEIFSGAQSLVSDAGRRGSHIGRNDAWTRSHRAKHWDKIAAGERKKLDTQVKKRQASFGERPSKSKGETQSPRDAAIAAMRGQ